MDKTRKISIDHPLIDLNHQWILKPLGKSGGELYNGWIWLRIPETTHQLQHYDM